MAGTSHRRHHSEPHGRSHGTARVGVPARAQPARWGGRESTTQLLRCLDQWLHEKSLAVYFAGWGGMENMFLNTHQSPPIMSLGSTLCPCSPGPVLARTNGTSSGCPTGWGRGHLPGQKDEAVLLSRQSPVQGLGRPRSCSCWMTLVKSLPHSMPQFPLL